jgi:hemoglobin
MRPLPLWPALSAFLVTLAFAGTAPAADEGEAPDPAALDRYLYHSLRFVINHGVDLFDRPDVKGCYQHYRRSLEELAPVLSHHPELQKSVQAALVNVDKDPKWRVQMAGQVKNAEGKPSLPFPEKVPEDWQKAFAMRAVLNDIRAAVRPGDKPKVVTLWERLGGEKNVRQVVDDFVAAAVADPKVNFDRSGKYKLDALGMEHLKRQLVTMVSQATGGPGKYDGKSMKEIHKGMGITDAEFTAAVGHLKVALEKNGVKPADVEAMLKGVEGTRKEIVEESKPEAAKLWDRLGGEKVVAKVIDDFIAAAAADPKVNLDRGGKYKLDKDALDHMKKQLLAMASEVAGGPIKYTGKDMKEAHKGMGITDAEFDAAVGHLKKALESNGVKPAEAQDVLKVLEVARKAIVEAKKPEGGKASVSGKVTFKGKPLPDGTVTFVPDKGPVVTAAIAEDGSYTAKDVAPGSYTLAVTSMKVALPAKYSGPETSPLKVEVKDGKQNFDVALE